VLLNLKYNSANKCFRPSVGYGTGLLVGAVLHITKHISCAPFGRLAFGIFSPPLRYGENVAYAGNVMHKRRETVR